MEVDNTTDIKVPIELRPNEQSQLESFIPRMEQRMRDSDLEEQANTLDTFSFTLDERDGVGNFASAEASSWEKVIQYLDILRDEEGLRVWWLRKKLAKRLALRLDEMEDSEDDEE